MPNIRIGSAVTYPWKLPISLLDSVLFVCRPRPQLHRWSRIGLRGTRSIAGLDRVGAVYFWQAKSIQACRFIRNIYSAKKETHMWFNRNFFRYGVYMTETTIYDWNQQFVRNQNLFVNLLLCETGVCSGPLSATRSITCVATSCFLHCSASAWHGWNQTCNLCMWDVIPGLLDSQTQLWEGLRRWVTWPYASINKVPQMLDRGQVGGICWPGQYLDSISSQKVLCEAGRVRASIILLKR